MLSHRASPNPQRSAHLNATPLHATLHQQNPLRSLISHKTSPIRKTSKPTYTSLLVLKDLARGSRSAGADEGFEEVAND